MRCGLFLGILCALAASGCVTTAPVVHAEDAKIGIIDIQRIIQESAPAQKAREAFLEEREAKRSVLLKKRQEVLRMQQEVQENQGLSEAQQQAEVERINQERKELSRLASDLEEELKKKDIEMTREVLEEVRQVVDRYRKAQGYTVILERKSVVSYDEAMDITGAIIQNYNAQSR